jgi:predicted PurR-regulated permease PerM
VQQIQKDIPRAQMFLIEKVQKLVTRWNEMVQPKEEPAPAARPKVTKESVVSPKEPPRVRLVLKEGGSIVGKVLDRRAGKVFLAVGDRVEGFLEAEIEREEPIARVRVVVAGDPPRELKGEILARRGDRLTLDTGAEVVSLEEKEIVEEESLTEFQEQAALDVKLLIARSSEQLARNLEELLGFVFAVARWVVSFVYQTFLIMMLTAFLIIDRDAILRFLKSVPTEQHRPTWARLLGYIDRGLAGVIRGQLLICLVNGLLTWMGLQFLGVSYPLLLGLVAGVLSLIPIFGTILSTVPIVLIAFGTSGWKLAFFSLLWILFIHFVEANFLNPKIMGTASKIHPVVIIFALLAGEKSYGIVGALLAVPAASIVQSLFRFYVIDRQTEIDDAPA